MTTTPSQIESRARELLEAIADIDWKAKEQSTDPWKQGESLILAFAMKIREEALGEAADFVLMSPLTNEVMSAEIRKGNI